MDRSSRIFITGHRGLVGSSLLRALNARGYRNLLTASHKELDLTDKVATERFFKRYRPNYVLHAAAKVGGIQANKTYPADFIYQNIAIQTNVIELSYRYGIKRLIYFGSSCAYPKFCPTPIKEDSILKGEIEPTSQPYAVAKIAGIKMCQAYNLQYGTEFITLIPSNLYGPNDRFDGTGHVIPSLIQRFHLAVLKGSPRVSVWGSGKPRRDFLYVDDLAEACILVMQQRAVKWDILNVATGVQTSIREVAELIKRIVGFRGKITFDTTRPDGMPTRPLDTERIFSLGWRPRIGLEEGLRATYAQRRGT
jgi:GDP-L-fucose synthase